MRRRRLNPDHARRLQTPALTVAQIRAGLDDETLVRGTSTKLASGTGMAPVRGAIVLAHLVLTVVPLHARHQHVLAWEITGDPQVDEDGWQAPVVAIQQRRHG